MPINIHYKQGCIDHCERFFELLHSADGHGDTILGCMVHLKKVMADNGIHEIKCYGLETYSDGSAITYYFEPVTIANKKYTGDRYKVKISYSSDYEAYTVSEIEEIL